MKQTIQFINFSALFRQNNVEKENVYISSLSDPETLNKFDINIINLDNPNIWRAQQSKLSNNLNISVKTDLENLSVMINTAKNTNIIVILPQSTRLKYYYGSTGTGRDDYLKSIRLRDCLDLYKVVIQNLLPMYYHDLIFENNETPINNINLKSSFYFFAVEKEDIVTKAKYGRQPTTIKLNEDLESAQILVTTLDLKEYSEIVHYLTHIDLVESEKAPIPEWINKIAILDDNDLRVEVKEIDAQVKNLIDQKEAKNKELETNNQYKEVLYESGVNLEKRVIELLEEMLDIDHSDFVDLKKEDFLMKLEDIIFIGEIKGYNRNLRDEDVFQLLGHASEYFHRLKDEGKNIEREKIKPLLIVNHQRNKFIDERIEIHQDQIEKAARDDMLVITTVKLLELFEEFKQEKITTSEIIKLLSEETGLLE